MAKYTKKAIVDTLVALLNKKPLSQITVRELTELCEINHNTFYYYFTDIYAVLDEVFTNELKSLQKTAVSTGSFAEVCSHSMAFIDNNRKAIRNIYNSISRDKLEEYLLRVIDQLVDDFYDRLAPEGTMTPEDRQFFSTYHKCALLGLVISQFARGKEDELNFMLNRFGELTESNIREHLQYAPRVFTAGEEEKRP